MALNTAALQLMSNALRTGITHLSLHSANPGTTGANPTSAARKPVTFTVDASGNLTAPATDFTGGAPSGPVTHVGFWSAATGGTFYGSDDLTGDLSFNAAGEYTVSSVTISASSTNA